ncbi:MAG: zinc ribbon domain-containing protein [Vicinamibacterales bacterium]
METTPTRGTPDAQAVAAVEKYPCAACGAQAEWNPSRQMLVCSFCGTAAPFSVDDKTGALVEHDLVRALREIPDSDRGWLEERRTVQCQSCKVVSVFDPVRVGQNCDFCGSPSLLDYTEIKAPIRPQGVLPFKVDAGSVREQIRKWFSTKWLAPNDLKRRGLVDRIHGVYIPYWTFDANVVCPWDGEAGHYYYTTEQYRDNKGNSQTRQVRHTRWESASGQITHFFDDEPVAGTHGVRQDLLRQVEPFATSELVGYDTAYLSGFVVEHYQVVLIEAAERSLESMYSKLMELCAAQVPGDTHRNLQIHPAYSERTFKHVLVPIWLLSYTYGATIHQVIVNGYSGQIAGDYPKSWWKILLLVVVVLIVVMLVIMAGDQ